jgi:hypothetical protein
MKYNTGKIFDILIPVMRNPRINVTFEEKTVAILVELAKEQQRSIASLVRELAIEALELREDLYLSKIADRLDQDGVKTYDHRQVKSEWYRITN